MKITLSILLLYSTLLSNTLTSKYYEINDTKAMKKEFFSFIKHIADIENKKIMDDRMYIINNFINKNNRLKSIQKRYGLNDDSTLKEHLYIIDIIPLSLVLAQSAIESGWGKSRFFKKAKNIFGQWTWTGKGLEPLKRDLDKKHKIKIFSSYQESVKAYLINLNKGWGYKDLRDLREKLRLQNKNLSGLVLAPGLIKYSQDREKYIKLLRYFIKSNDLHKYDK